MSHRPDVEAMLERQIRFSEVQRRLARERSAGRVDALADQGPWISLSCQLGSGGLELAAALAARLDWQVFDQEILKTIAANHDTLQAVVASMDQHAIGPVTDYLTHALDSSLPERVPFLQEVSEVICGLARRGNAIVIGRGANWFLNSECGLRVRAIAPLESRVMNEVQPRKLGKAETERLIRNDDETREAFIRQVFKQDIDDPTGYDLVLNLGSLTIDAATEVVAVALRHKLQRHFASAEA
jgi:hypothetical protein